MLENDRLQSRRMVKQFAAAALLVAMAALLEAFVIVSFAVANGG